MISGCDAGIWHLPPFRLGSQTVVVAVFCLTVEGRGNSFSECEGCLSFGHWDLYHYPNGYNKYGKKTQ